jgi:phosphate transport system ATP-binding protein
MAMNRLSELIPGCKVTGSIRLESEEILDSNLDLVQLRRRIGMIFQKPNPFPFSIRKNLSFPLKEHGITKGLDALLEEALQDVGLWKEVKDRLDAPAQALSGGQQQRLCLARALVLKPEVLLLDEPCSALDPIASGVVEDMIVRLRGRFTVVVVTHNLAQARRIADHVGVFWVHDGAGQLIEFGSAQQIFETPAHDLTKAYVSGQRG